jgi:hypothetical protein
MDSSIDRIRTCLSRARAAGRVAGSANEAKGARRKSRKSRQLEKALKHRHPMVVRLSSRNSRKSRECLVSVTASPTAPTGGTSKSDSESSIRVRSRSATKRESGALIRAGVASNACARRGHRHGDAVGNAAFRTVRNNRDNRASIACRPAMKHESGALIRAGVASGTWKSDGESSVTPAITEFL